MTPSAARTPPPGTASDASDAIAAEGRGPALGVLRLLVWLSALLPALLLGVLGAIAWRDGRRDLERSLEHTVDLVHEHALRTFDTYALVAAQSNEFVRDLTDEEVRALERDINERLQRLATALPQIQDIWLIDAEGRPLVSANVSPMPPISLADREYFRVHVPQPRPAFVSEILRGRVMNVEFFQISWRLRSPEGPFSGVTAVSVQPEYYRNVHGRIARETGFAIALQRSDGVLLVGTPSGRDEPGSAEQRAKALAGRPGSKEAGDIVELTRAVTGRSELAAVRPIDGYPVLVTVSAPRRVLVEQWAGDMAGYLALGVPASLALFFLSITALRQTQRQARALERLEAEARRRETAEATLRQVQKMEAVGRLTGGVAHDFNNLLTVVIGNLDMLIRRLAPEDARARRSASLAKEGAVRASLLTQRLLAFSRQQPLEPRRTDLASLLTGMTDLTRRTLGEGITVRSETEPGLWPVDVDQNQLENAILNLAVNARDAMPAGGKLTLHAYNLVVREHGGHPDDPQPGSWVVIDVTDTGVGMPEGIQTKVFEPFFTTKPHGKGTGLGLSQVYGFLKQSGGHVRILSRLGEGTTVRLFLPRAQGESSATPVNPEEPGAVRDTLSADRLVALVVEDEPTVRAFSADALRDLGFHVIEADDAASALRQLAQPQQIDLLFSDVGLPGTDGRTLAREALTQRRDLKVLLTSGYAHQILGGGDDDFDLLPKPFTTLELERRVAAVLGRDRSGEPLSAAVG